MPACPQCGAVYDSTQRDVERCEACGCYLPSRGTVQPSVSDTSVPQPIPAARSEPPQPAAPSAPPAKRSAEAFIQPRTLSPEYAARVTAHWEGTHSAFKNPKETIHSNAATSEDDEGLIIGMRNVVNVDDENRGDYELTEIIGQGGMGQVWSARQASLNRNVALKFPHAQSKGSQRDRDKFIFEVVVTGRLDHPNIVPIYDFARDAEGRLFYAMKRVEGRPWDKCIHDGTLSQEQNIEILMKVCDALRFAHDNGVIHCDIKPHNIMVGRYGEVSVMDFGAAVRLDGGPGSVGSGKASPGGTPAYMAPEIAANGRGQICPATDVYLLGAVLYEILAGEPPHPPPRDSKSHKEMIREAALIAAENRITPLNKSGELVDIVYKAMATEVSRRYQSVDDFQKAIRNYLSHAESIALAEHGQQHLRRATDEGHASPASLGVRFDEFDRARFAFDDAIKLWPENRAAKKGLEDTTLAYANYALREGAYSRGISLLDPQNPDHALLLKKLNSARKFSNRAWFLVRWAAVIIVTGGVALSAVIYFQNQTLHDTNTTLKSTVEERDLALETVNEQYKSLDNKNRELALQTRRAESNAVLASINETEAIWNELDARKNANEAHQQRESAESNSYVAEIGNAEEALQRNGFDAVIHILSDQVSTPNKNRLRDWEWGYLNYLATKQPTQRFEPNDVRYEAAAISPDPDGQWVVAGTVEGKVLVWQRNNPQQPIVLPSSVFRTVRSVAIAQSGDKYVIAAAGTVGDSTTASVIKRWSLVNGQSELLPSIERQGLVLSLDLSRDASELLIGCDDGSAELYRDTAMVKSYRPRSNRQNIWSAHFSPDAERKWIVTASDDGFVRVWDKNEGEEVEHFTGHQGPVLFARFSADGQHVISGGQDGRLFAGQFRKMKPEDWRAQHKEDVEEGLKSAPMDIPVSEMTLIGQHAAPIKSLSVSPDNAATKYVFSASNDNTLAVWDITKGIDQAALHKTLRGHGGWVRACAATGRPDNQRVLSAGYDGRLLIWDFERYQSPRVLTYETSENLQRQQLTSSALGIARTPGNNQNDKVEWIATGADNGRIVVWDMRKWESPMPAPLSEGHDWQATTGIVFHDGRRLLTAGGDNTTLVWDADRGSELHRIGKWFDQGTGWRGIAAVSNDGRIATGSGDGRVEVEKTIQSVPILAQIWNSTTGKLLASCLVSQKTREADEPPAATALAFSPDDKVLAVGDESGTCYLFNATSGTLQRSIDHGDKLVAMRFAPDGRFLFTAGADRRLIKWDLAMDPPRSVMQFAHDDQLVAMDLSADAKHIITAAGPKDRERAVRVWDSTTGTLETALSLQEVLTFLGLPAPTGDISENEDVQLPAIRSVAFHPDRPIALLTVYSPLAPKSASGQTSRDRSHVVQWDWRAAQDSLHLVAKQRDVSMAVFSRPPREQVLTVGGRGARLLNPVNAGRNAPFGYVTAMSFQPQNCVNALSFSADAKLLASAARDGSIKIWKLDAARGWIPGPTIPAEPKPGGGEMPICSIAFNPQPSSDGSYEFVTAGANRVQLWASADDSFHVTRTFDSENGQMVQAIFSDDGKRILGVAKNQAIFVWDPTTGKELRRLKESVQCVDEWSSPDDKHIWIAAGCQTEAKIWNETSDEPFAKAVGHWGDITALCFSADGQRLFTASQDFLVKVWNTTPRENEGGLPQIDELLTLSEHQGFVTSVAYVPHDSNNSFLLTTGRDGQAILWPSDMNSSSTAAPIATARSLPKLGKR